MKEKAQSDTGALLLDFKRIVHNDRKTLHARNTIPRILRSDP